MPDYKVYTGKGIPVLVQGVTNQRDAIKEVYSPLCYSIHELTPQYKPQSRYVEHVAVQGKRSFKHYAIEYAQRYRTDAYGNSKVRSALEILSYALYELGNTGNIHYLLDNTKYLRNPILRKWLERQLELIENDPEHELTPADAVRICQSILTEISYTTGRNIQYALWLADYNRVYSPDSPVPGYSQTGNDIDTYFVSDIVLVDLGIDGTLYGYDYLPHPIPNIS